VDVLKNRSIADGTVNPVIEQSQVTMIFAVAVSIFCAGGIIGGAATGYVAERFGRKGGLLINNVFVVLAALLQGQYLIFVVYLWRYRNRQTYIADCMCKSLRIIFAGAMALLPFMFWYWSN
jgi:Sugar (and other) transporter.